MRDKVVMLSAAKHLGGLRTRPFAAAQGDIRWSSMQNSPVMLSRSEASRCPTRQTFRCAQGDTMMRIG